MNTAQLLMLVSMFCYANGDHIYHVEIPEKSIRPAFTEKRQIHINDEELTSEYWIKMAREKIILQHRRLINKNKAKNVIFFLGDGMSIPTQTATRAYIGQMAGKSGEEVELSFEKFPVSGLVKTYCLDAQVGDSACTATAYLGGVKANFGTIGVNGQVPRYSCEKMQDNTTHVESLAKVFLDVGKSVGIVTTAAVVDASPAGLFGHTAERSWVNDENIFNSGHDPEKCRDLAYQLVHGETGRRIQVILGGGRDAFLSNQTTDEEGYKGTRRDGRNLIEEWKTQKLDHEKVGTYVWNRDQLLAVQNSSDFLLGLFESAHCQYNLEANKSTEPSLTEMMEVALSILSQNEKGFFLFVEGGRIDHGHHDTMARIALDETAEFSKAIARAVELTSSDDTLLVVTADHSHTMSLSGYSNRGNDILGSAGSMHEAMASDDQPYLTINYAIGPGYRPQVNGKRADVTKEDMDKEHFVYPSLVPRSLGAHAGEDVGIFAYGPWQHLFTGVYEQSSIPHIIKYATCVNEELSACSSAEKISSILSTTLILVVGVFLTKLL